MRVDTCNIVTFAQGMFGSRWPRSYYIERYAEVENWQPTPIERLLIDIYWDKPPGKLSFSQTLQLSQEVAGLTMATPGQLSVIHQGLLTRCCHSDRCFCRAKARAGDGYLQWPDRIPRDLEEAWTRRPALIEWNALTLWQGYQAARREGKFLDVVMEPPPDVAFGALSWCCASRPCICGRNEWAKNDTI